MSPRLLFCSYHGYLDIGSGAALATRDLLELLAALGWDCAALSGPDVDSPAALCPADVLRAEGVSCDRRPGPVDGVPATLYHAALNGVAVHAFVPDAHRIGRPPADEESRAFLGLFDRVRARLRPDILLTFGGHALMFPMLRRARSRGAKAVFNLQNCEYTGTDVFREVDAVMVPSEAARDHYRRLGVESAVLPGPFNRDRVLCDASAGRHATLVSPHPVKGAAWFARVAAEVGRVRPDVPFLAVEGRGHAGWLGRSGIDPAELRNVRVMAATVDPRAFYRESRAVLVPSLWKEAFGRVAAEAMMSGIPVLASDRGGLPEAL
ncbi:MAG: glycosyltransferase, partial [Gemmataceae bacterium]